MSEEDPDPSPAPRFTVAGMPPGGSVMANKLAAIGEGLGSNVLKGISPKVTGGTNTIMRSIGSDYAAIANRPFVNMQAKLTAPGGPLDWSRYTKITADTAATAAALAPAAQWQAPEIPDWSARLDELDLDFVAPASDATTRELLEEFRAESERTRIRHEAEIADRRRRYEALEARADEDRRQAETNRLEERQLVEADRAATARRHKVNLVATIVLGLIGSASTFIAGLVVAG